MTPAPTSCAPTAHARTRRAADNDAAMLPMLAGALPAQLPDGRTYWVIPPSDAALLAAARDLALLDSSFSSPKIDVPLAG